MLGGGGVDGGIALITRFLHGWLVLPGGSAHLSISPCIATLQMSSLTCYCAAIHRAAGPSLLQACRRYPDILNERCATGDARVTL